MSKKKCFHSGRVGEVKQMFQVPTLLRRIYANAHFAVYQFLGAGGGYMFSGRPSVPLSVRPSVIHVVVLCFGDISSKLIC